MSLDRNGLEVLDRTQCFDLLRTESFGRIGANADALPVVLPVNYCMVDDQLIVRTGRGTKLEAATRNAVVAFEVDSFDRETGAGWSVLVRGIAREVTSEAETAAGERAGLATWLHDGEARYVSVSLDIVSGRRLCPASVSLS